MYEEDTMIVNPFRLVGGILFIGLAFAAYSALLVEQSSPVARLPVPADLWLPLTELLFAFGFIFTVAGLPGKWDLLPSLLLGLLIYLLVGLGFASSIIVPVLGWGGLGTALGRPEILQVIVAWPYQLLAGG